MDPLPFAPYHLAPDSQTVRYSPWLKVSVALRYAPRSPETPGAGAKEVET
jgi:hypothetical protein